MSALLEIADLRVRLQAWMDGQDDKGVATEQVANQHKKKKPKANKKTKS